jgi:4-alpha-glucanotransferase
MLQLYSLHSDESWGMGDLGDLTTFLSAAGRASAGSPGLVLLNPLHAITPTLPVADSPYSPSSRRFANPLYLRVTDTAEYRWPRRLGRPAGQRPVDPAPGRPGDGLQLRR